MHFRSFRLWSMSVLVGVGLLVVGHTPRAVGQSELARKVRTRVAPTYPELARRMNLRGSVKVMVTVLPNGDLKDTKVMGGNPILVNAALEALKKWKFEPGPEEDSGTVEFKFAPTE